MHDVYINGLGAFLPGPPVPSAEMEDYLGRVGGKPSRHRALVLRQNRIKTRHYALGRDGKARHSSAGMSGQAIRRAVENSELALGDISYLAASSTLGDVLVPGLASHIHADLGLPPIELANFQSVCASALMALKSAWLQVRTGEHGCAAVSGCEFSSRYFRPGFYEEVAQVRHDGRVPLDADFLRFTLSDGAGAAVLEARPNQRQMSLKIKWIELRSYADRFDICMLGGGVRGESGARHWSEFDRLGEAVEAGAFMLNQDFELMRRMIPVWVSHYVELIDRGLIEVDAIDHVCSHYSSHSLREEAVALLDKAGALIDEEKWFSNLSSKGNTGTASIFIMLEELYASGRLESGHRILCHVPESGRCINGFMLLEVTEATT